MDRPIRLSPLDRGTIALVGISDAITDTMRTGPVSATLAVVQAVPYPIESHLGRSAGQVAASDDCSLRSPSLPAAGRVVTFAASTLPPRLRGAFGLPTRRQKLFLATVIRCGGYLPAAGVLGLSPNTLKNYCSDLFRRLGVSGTVQAVRRLWHDREFQVLLGLVSDWPCRPLRPRFDRIPMDRRANP